MNADSIAKNLTAVRDAIANAAAHAGRRAETIKLIAVSKTHSRSAIDAARRAGQHAFGESTTQEALPKITELHDAALEWHFIGHLQSNKTKLVPGHFQWLHSLDDLKLAQRLSRAATELGATLQCLIEINVTGDPKKHGVAPAQLDALLEQLVSDALPGIRLRGLMTIGPYGAPEAELRAVFARLRALRDASAARFALPDFTELSMGMSGDYVEAIKEDATMVRIGTAIFGERDYANG